jgi:hypothetical protein
MRGPYQAQSGILAKGLAARGHKVHFLTMGSFRHERAYTSAAAIASAAGGGPVVSPPVNDGWDRLTYVAFSQSNNLTDDINRVLHAHRIDAMVALSNWNDVREDQINAELGQFIGRTIAWFPNHYDSLDVFYTAALARFSHVAALAPTDARMVGSSIPDVQVSAVPHIVEAPAGFDATYPGAERRRELRQRHGMPEGAFVVLVVAGNYDSNNRKSFDVSLLAFKARAPRHHISFLAMPPHLT